MFWPIVFVALKVIWVLQVMMVLVVVTQWAGMKPDHRFVRLLRRATDPMVELVRPIARKIPGPMDWSPALVVLGLEGVARLLKAVFG